MEDLLKKQLTRGNLLIGTIVTLPSPEVAEILCLSGFDWLFVDLEHSALSIQDAQVILQAAAPQIPGVIRVPKNDEVWIKKALDTGTSGIIVPLVRTAQEAEAAVRLCKYPPQGARSVGISRAQGYGRDFQEYVESANNAIAVIIQIEHADAVNNIDDIVKVSGIDCLFIGPYDLSASMGKIGNVTDPDVQNAILHVKNRAEQAKIPLGIFGATAEAVDPYIRSGYTLIAVGIDAMMLGNAARTITKSLK